MKRPLKIHWGLPGRPLCKEPRAKVSSHWLPAITCKRCLHFLALGQSRTIGKAAALGMPYSGYDSGAPSGDIYQEFNRAYRPGAQPRQALEHFRARWPELSYAWKDPPLDTMDSWPPWLAAQDDAA